MQMPEHTRLPGERIAAVWLVPLLILRQVIEAVVAHDAARQITIDAVSGVASALGIWGLWSVAKRWRHKKAVLAASQKE